MFFSRYTVLHELVEVLLEVTACFFPELGVHPHVGLHPRALLDSEGSVNLREAQTAAGFGSGAHNFSCCGGWVPAFEPR